MSVAWLVPAEPATCAIRASAGLRVLAAETGRIEEAAELLVGLEIIVTSEVLVDRRLLERCRWIRAIVGVGPDAGEIVDWAFAESRGLLRAIVDASAGETAALEELAATLARMERRLRMFDDIAEAWEGT